MRGPITERPRTAGVRSVDSWRDHQGSVLLLVLFVCLAVAVIIQTLVTVVLCAEGAVVDESVGRIRLAEKDKALAALRHRALTQWQPASLTLVTGGSADADGILSELSDSSGCVMGATVRQAPSVSRVTVSAWLERGRDGVDLPVTGVVAGELTAGLGRETAWVEREGGAASGPTGASPTDGVVGYVLTAPVEPVLGEGLSLAELVGRWRLDDGWNALGSTVAHDEGDEPVEEGATAGVAAAVAPGLGVVVLQGRLGGTETLPDGCHGLTPDAPALVVTTGGASLDIRDRGDFYGVIVVNDGSVYLEGTTLHGAVFATHTVSLGMSGRVVYSQSILRGATDRSLQRVRLVPGTRWEGVE